MTTLRSKLSLLLIVSIGTTAAQAAMAAEESTVLAFVPTIPAIQEPRMSVMTVDDSCQYGYGACEGWNPTAQRNCDPGTRPCHEAGGTYCRAFPECR